MKDQTVIKTLYKHIDNGGVSVSIVDMGADEGIFLKLEAEYYGYPAVSSQIRIDDLGKDWLKEVGLMFLSAYENK